MSVRPSFVRSSSALVLVITSAFALSAGGCGRRGQPEPPSQVPQQSRQSSTNLSTSPQAIVETTPDGERTDRASVSPQPTPGPTGRRPPPFQVPQQPFILDPLL